MIPGRCSISVLRVAPKFSKQYNARGRNSASDGLLISSTNKRLDLSILPPLFPKMASTSAKDEGKKSNKLALEKSPYLLQHAYNPVYWYPWGDEALEKARREDKLIFLSVGYSTCHWCHVMEEESFENPEIAQVMNRFFVNIKVDREERPDIDRIYMTFIQSISGHGGWPMSVFLTPNLTPVTGGTYFPPEDKYGQPGFKRVLLKIAHEWLERKKDIINSSSKIFQMLKESAETTTHSKQQGVTSMECAFKCVKRFQQEFDEEFGGFSSAPKFPQPVKLNFLFAMYMKDPGSEMGKHCLHMCLHTLQKIALGGIHDHVGQGFARYSVDGKWHVPHFEKMLYDQGQLLQSYADAFMMTKDPFYAEIADDIVTYVTRDLRHPEGGFYSAEDADSYPTHDSGTKKEGAFYVWTFDEIEHMLDKEVSGGKRLSDIFCHHFCVKPEGNVRKYQDPHGELTKQNVLIVYGTLEETAENFGLSVESAKAYLKEALEILYEARKDRPRPHLDDKIITAWNGLMISGLAHAGSSMQNQKYIEYAEAAAKFVEKYLFDKKNNVLLRSCYREGDAISQMSVPIKAFHADYAFMVKGLLDLYEASFNSHWLEFAEKLQDIQDELFWDAKDGGYFASTKEDSSVILRLKDEQDGAEPSSNAVACRNLLVLSTCLDRLELKEKAEKILISQSEQLTVYPAIFPELLCALVYYLDFSTQIYIAGKKDAEDTKALLHVVQRTLVPGKTVLLADQENSGTILFQKNKVISKMNMLQGRATAFVCRHHVCSLPVTDPDELAALLTAEK